MAPFICKYSPISTVLLSGPKCTPSLVQLIMAASRNWQRNSSDSPGAATKTSGWEIWYLVGGSAERQEREDGDRWEGGEGEDVHPTQVSRGPRIPRRAVLVCTWPRQGWPLPGSHRDPQEARSGPRGGRELSVGNRNQRKPPAEAAPRSCPTPEGFHHSPGTQPGRLLLYESTFTSIANATPACLQGPAVRSWRNSLCAAFFYVSERAFYKLFRST